MATLATIVVAGLIAVALDAPTATVIVALVGGAVTIGVKIIPKTAPEAAVDRAAARLTEEQGLAIIVEQYRKTNGELRDERDELLGVVDALRLELVEVRRRCEVMERRFERMLDERRRPRPA